MSSIKFLILLSTFAIIYSYKFADNAEVLFQDFKRAHARHYASADEEEKRFKIFTESMERVDRKNDLNGSPVFGVTKFSDWTPEEFKVLLGRKQRAFSKPSRLDNVRSPDDVDKHLTKLSPRIYSATSDVVNWADEGYVTPVKNQGQCGSCWAFSVTEQIESQWAFNGNAIWEFSPQQVASCTTTCDGCGGGESYLAYEYLIGTGVGLGSSWYAPYIQSMYKTCETARCTEECSTFNLTDLVTYGPYTGPYAAVSDYSYATPACDSTCTDQNTTLLAANVAVYGPASICVNAETWNDYTGGVLSQTACGGYALDDLDHCVQLVGYNAAATNPYWLVRNSWAINWGLKGYILLEYPANTCGLADEATFVSISNSQVDFS